MNVYVCIRSLTKIGKFVSEDLKRMAEKGAFMKAVAGRSAVPILSVLCRACISTVLCQRCRV